jgi:hypothetical protein
MTENTFVHSHPEIMSGTPVFVGTRVPVQALFDYLEEDGTIDEFLDSFPTVTRERHSGSSANWRKESMIRERITLRRESLESR